MITYLQRLSYVQLLISSAIISLLLNLIALIPNSPINVDGILYIQTAQAYQQQGWHAAFALYPWPFFSILGAWLHKLTGLELLYSFNCINILLQALLVISFIDLNKKLGGDERTQRWAAFVILIYPLLNSIRDYATRDSGYWAFALLAICLLIQLMKTSQMRYAIAFGISMSIATLFRVEGSILLALTPFALFFQPKPFLSRCGVFLKANSILILALLIGVFFYALHPTQHATHTNRLIEIKEQLFTTIPHAWSKFNQDAAHLSTAILNVESMENGRLILFGGLLYLFLYATIYVIKPLYFILGLYGQCTSRIQNKEGQLGLLYWLIIINALMLLIFVGERYFLATRYPVFLALLWMSWVPFSLTLFFQRWKNKQGPRWLWPLIFLILISMAISGIVRFGYSKSYITEAGYWLNQHTQENDHILTNSKEVAFYTSRRLTDLNRASHIILITNETSIDNVGWIALRVNKHDVLAAPWPQFIQTHQPIAQFMNKRKDAVLIYKYQQ